MKRDYTLYLAIGILAIAVLMLAAPQIYRLQNPITYNIPANPNGQPIFFPPPTLLPSDVISPTNTISPTIPISVTETVSPTIVFSPTVVFSPTATITPAATISPTETISPTATISPTGSISPTGTISGTTGVIIKNYAYSPASLTVPLGTTVKWTQLDSAAHTVSAGSPSAPDRQSAFNSPILNLKGTDTFAFTFDQPGIYSYFCVFHSQMLGTVIVTDAQGNVPTPAPAAPASTPTPVVFAPPTNAQVIVQGLINPRGFVRGPDGAIYIAESGTVPDTITATVEVSPTTIISSTATIGSTGTISGTTTTTPPAHPTVSPICESQLPSYDKQAAGCPGATGPQVSNKGRISRIAPDGTRTTIADNLPVTVGPFNDVFGVNSVAFVGNDLYVIIAAGASRGHPDFPTGVYRVSSGKTTIVADLEAFQKADPPKFIPPDYNYTLPYDMLSLNGKLYITDGNAAVVFEVDPAAPAASNIKRIVDLSPTHNVLTGIAAGADGSIFFTEFTPGPYPVGGAQIFKWSATGGLSLVTKGLSVATGIALAPDGSMYASEFASDLGTPPYIAPPGRIVKIGTDGKTQTVATPIVYPTALRWIDGALYVTAYGVNAIDGQPGDGAIYRITPGP